MQKSLNRKSFQQVLTLVFAMVVLAVGVQAQEIANHHAEVKIKNFGQVDDRFFRGAQPKTEDDYKALAAMGINTVIDLTEDPKEYEKPMVEASGMKYVHIPMVAKKYPTEAATKSSSTLSKTPTLVSFIFTAQVDAIARVRWELFIVTSSMIGTLIRYTKK